MGALLLQRSHGEWPGTWWAGWRCLGDGVRKPAGATAFGNVPLPGKHLVIAAVLVGVRQDGVGQIDLRQHCNGSFAPGILVRVVQLHQTAVRRPDDLRACARADL